MTDPPFVAGHYRMRVIDRRSRAVAIIEWSYLGVSYWAEVWVSKRLRSAKMAMRRGKAWCAERGITLDDDVDSL